MWSRPVVQCIGRMSYISFSCRIRPNPQPLSKIHDGEKCAVLLDQIWPIYREERASKVVLFRLRPAAGLILWDTSVTRVNGRFASDQPCYSSIYHLQLCSSDQVMTYHIHPKYLFFCFKSESFRKGRYWQELNYVYNCQNSPVHP